MKQLPRLIAITCLLCLTLLGAACGALPGSDSAYSGTDETGGSLLSTPGMTPYPAPPTRTRAPTQTNGPTVPDDYTPPPAVTRTPTSIPTITPLPTALPVQPAAFYILWVEKAYFGSPRGPKGIIWVADPRDIANRREVVRFDDRQILYVALSPNGRQVALTAVGGEDNTTSPLWIVNLDGTDLRQIVPDAGQILWSRDGRSIFYSIGSKGEGEDGWGAIEKVDLSTGQVRQILTLEQSGYLQPLGFSADGQWLYYLRAGAEGPELWQVRQDGSTAEYISSLGTEMWPESFYILLSPGGTNLLLGLRWLSTDGQESGRIQLPHRGQAYQLLWGETEDEVIVGQMDEDKPHYRLYAVNIHSQQARELAAFGSPPPGWDRLALSPDRQWAAVHLLYRDDYYWVHLPSGILVPVPHCQECEEFVVGWAEKTAP